MAFPFRSQTQSLRDQLLIAIGSTGLAVGCVASSESGALPGGDSPPIEQAGPISDPPAVPGTDPTPAPGEPAPPSEPGDDSTGGMSMDPNAGSDGGASPDATTPADAAVQCEFGQPQRQCFDRAAMEGMLQVECGQILRDPPYTQQELDALFLDNGCLPIDKTCDGCCNPPLGESEPQDDGTCCYDFCEGSCCGRPFTVNGEVRTAPAVQRGDWRGEGLGMADVESLPLELRRRIAREWVRDAQMEHASIASFARFTQELLALAAPADLVEGSVRAGLDEVAHAQDCFAMAARYEAEVRGPGALRTFDARPAASLQAAVEGAIAEGCVGETLAAAQAMEALEHVQDPEARKVLTRIAQDEARHAELAWRFVAWALKYGDPSLVVPVRNAFSRALKAVPTVLPELEDEQTLAALHAAGRLSDSEQAQCHARALAEIVGPCSGALFGAPDGLSVLALGA